jgi:hypothetical protein
MKKAGDFEKTQPMSQHLKSKPLKDKTSQSSILHPMANLESTIQNENYWQNIQEIVRSSFSQTVSIIKELQY